MTVAASRASDLSAEKFQQNARRASRLIKSLSNEHRLQIVCLLVDGEISVGQLEGRLGISQSSLSRHLARLRRDALVSRRRRTQTIYYSLRGRQAITLIEVLHGLYCQPNQAQAKHRLSLSKRDEGGESTYSI